MKHKLKSVRALAATLITFGSLTGSSHGATLTVSSFSDSAITFTVTGTLSGSAPSLFLDQLFLSSSVAGDDDWVLALVPGTSATFSNSPIIGVAFQGADSATQDSGNFDYIRLDLASNLTAGQSFLGSPITVTAPSGTFAPENLDGPLVLSWGYNGEGGTPFGVQQAVATVPEPSSALLLGLSAFVLSGYRRRAR